MPPPRPPGLGRGLPPGIGKARPPPRGPRGPRGPRAARGARGPRAPRAVPPPLKKVKSASAAPRPPPGVARATPKAPSGGVRPAPRPPPGISTPTKKKSPPPTKKNAPSPTKKKATPLKSTAPAKTSSTAPAPAPAPAKTSTPVPRKKRPVETEQQIKQKNRKLREELDDIKDNIRKEKKDHENEKKLVEMKAKIKKVEERIKLLGPISSSDLHERLNVVIQHIQGGKELTSLADDTKKADETLANMAKQLETANGLTKTSMAKLTKQRQSTDGKKTFNADNAAKLRRTIQSYQSAKQQVASAIQSGKFSSSVVLQMKKLIHSCDDFNENEDQLSAKFVSLQKDTSKAMGEAWQQTAVHKFRLDVGIIPGSNGKEAKLLAMEDEVGQTMLEEREASQQRMVERLNNDTKIFEQLATKHRERTESLRSTHGQTAPLENDIAQSKRTLRRCNEAYRAGKQHEKQVLHEFQKLKVGYLAEYHQDVTAELKLHRKTEKRQKLLDEHLMNIQTTQDEIVMGIETDWAPVLEKEEVTGENLLMLAKNSRVGTEAKLRFDTVNQIEASYQPAVVQLMENIKALTIKGEDLNKVCFEVETKLRSKLEDANELDREKDTFRKEQLRITFRSKTAAAFSNDKDIKKCQNQLRLLWQQGAVSMTTVENFLNQLSENTIPTDMLIGLYESYSTKLDSDSAE